MSANAVALLDGRAYLMIYNQRVVNGGALLSQNLKCLWTVGVDLPLGLRRIYVCMFDNCQHQDVVHN